MTDNIPTRIRVSPDDLPRWAAIRDHIRTDLQSRPGVHRIANPLDSRIVGEMLVVLTQFYRLPDPGFRYSDGPACWRRCQGAATDGGLDPNRARNRGDD